MNFNFHKNILQFVVYNLDGHRTQHTHFIDLHASHVSHKFDDVWHWWVILTLCLCVCVLCLSVCTCMRLCLVYLYVCCFLCMSTSSSMCSLHPCLCVPVPGLLSPLFCFSSLSLYQKDAPAVRQLERRRRRRHWIHLIHAKDDFR